MVSRACFAVLLMNDGGLEGLAKMLRSGLTLRRRIWAISVLEAQSKPVPIAARRRSTNGSGLHFTATTCILAKGKHPERDVYAHHRRVLFQVGTVSIFDIGCTHSSGLQQNRPSPRLARQ